MSDGENTPSATPDRNAVDATDLAPAADGVGPPDLDRVRAVFVSDVHLGCEYARADAFLAFIESVRPDVLYLVGDFIDGWRLKKRWYWVPAYDDILGRMVTLIDGGTRVCYTPGNHDEFLRDFPIHVDGVTIRDEFVHQTADGRRVLVLHGDRFDVFERQAKWISVVLTFAYDWLLWANRLVGFGRGRGRPDYAFSAAVKSRAKWVARFFSDFERSVAKHAKRVDCVAAVCGHIHKPSMQAVDGVLYANSGDWIEHATALVEYDDGRLELVEADGQRYRRLTSMTGRSGTASARPDDELATVAG
ncbi:MAG: UDP-2,3-diacylglucosamine diphosphatase [Planctomycetota bacterium]